MSSFFNSEQRFCNEIQCCKIRKIHKETFKILKTMKRLETQRFQKEKKEQEDIQKYPEDYCAAEVYAEVSGANA